MLYWLFVEYGLCFTVLTSLCFQAKLDEAVSLATGFQSSLQDTINWLTGAEQTLNMAQAPSLILDTVVFQIDEHKVGMDRLQHGSSEISEPTTYQEIPHLKSRLT